MHVHSIKPTASQGSFMKSAPRRTARPSHRGHPAGHGRVVGPSATVHPGRPSHDGCVLLPLDPRSGPLGEAPIICPLRNRCSDHRCGADHGTESDRRDVGHPPLMSGLDPASFRRRRITRSCTYCGARDSCTASYSAWICLGLSPMARPQTSTSSRDGAVAGGRCFMWLRVDRLIPLRLQNSAFDSSKWAKASSRAIPKRFSSRTRRRIRHSVSNESCRHPSL
jgi:hypothetical protein